MIFVGQCVILIYIYIYSYYFIFNNGNVGLSNGPPLWSRLKYLSNYVVDCREILPCMFPRG